MKITLMALGLLMVPFSAGAAVKADARAVESCKATSSNFVEISACLPEAHVAVMGLDAFEKIYPPAAHPLAEKCKELNGTDIAGAFTCVSEAIKSALKLSESLPDGTTIGDPVFDALTDPKMKSSLDEVRDAARAGFPDQSFWGGRMYRAYK